MRRLQEAFNGVEALVPWESELRRPAHGTHRQFELLQIRNLLQALPHVDGPVAVDQREPLGAAGGTSHVRGAVELFQRISSANIMQKRSPIVPQLRAVTVRWSTILSGLFKVGSIRFSVKELFCANIKGLI